MAKEGLWACACAGALVVGMAAPARPGAPEDRDGAVAVTLAVQTAMQQGRDHLLRNNPRAAVEVLEAQLPRINGNPTYLLLLRDAYRAYVRELRLTNQEALAQTYQKRLEILDPTGATAAPAVARPAMPATADTAVAPAAAKAPTFRGYRQEDEDPFRPANLARLATPDLQARADEAFARDNFREAERLYGEAQRGDRPLTVPGRERWAYCKLHRVVGQLNGAAPDYEALEADTRAAIELAPRIEYSRRLLDEIRKRRSGAAREDATPVAVRHLGRTAEGWAVEETTNFRVYHAQSAEWGERTARTAEQTRSAMYRKWFGSVAPAWEPKCEIYLHANANAYSRATGVPAASPGHSSFRLESGRVVGRRIDLHCDDPAILQAVLPHEATHVVLAGNFGEQPVPRWADEGVAVLTEPRAKIDRHLRNLPRHRAAGELFGVRELVQMPDYPQPNRVGAFYAQSVSLVEFLVRERGAQTFTQFVRDGLAGGYDTALARHYGWTFDELERRWQAAAFSDPAVPAGVAQASR